MSRTRTITVTIGSLAAGALLATGVTGLALADDQGGTTGASGAASAMDRGAMDRGAGDRGGHGMRGPRGGLLGDRLGEPLHGEMVVKAEDGTITTVRTIHGSVTAVSATSITVEAEDGYTTTFAVADGTEVRVGLPERGSDPTTSTDSIGEISVGDVAHVHGTVTGSTATATHVMAMTAAEAAELESMRAEHEARHDAQQEATSSSGTASQLG